MPNQRELRQTADAQLRIGRGDHPGVANPSRAPEYDRGFVHSGLPTRVTVHSGASDDDGAPRGS